MDIGQRIKAIAESKNISVKELAEKIGRTRQSVYDIYSGKVSVNVEQLEKLASALDVDIVNLFIRETQIRQSRDDIIRMMKTVFTRIIDNGYFNFFHIQQLIHNIYIHATIGEGLVNLNLAKVSGEYDYPFIETYKPIKVRLTDTEIKEYSTVAFEKGAMDLTQIIAFSNYDQIITDFISENYNIDK